MTQLNRLTIARIKRRFLVRGLLHLIASRCPAELAKKAFRLWRREGYRGLLRVLAYVSINDSNFELAYARWVEHHDTLTSTDRKLIQEHIASFAYQPRISVLMPVHNTPKKWLRLAIESVRRQIYPHWELCIADDASTLPHVRAILDEAQRSDPRIKVAYRSTNGHISAASNTALEMATGEFVALLDHDDELAKHALYLVADALNRNPDLDLIYSDEDKINMKGRRFSPYFKPDWNPDLFQGQNLISHLGVYRTSVALAVGGFRQGFEGSQDWDFALRVVDSIDAARIYHIPHVLYHWRTVPGSTALSIDEKDYAALAGRNALEEHWRRQRISVRIESVARGHFHVVFPVPDPPPLVSIIIPTHNGLAFLQSCLNGLFVMTDYPAMEIIVVDNQSDDPATLAFLANLAATGRIRLLRYDAPFNFSAINNKAVRNANGELICLLNNDVEPIVAHWLREMVSHAIRPEIGAVGAMLYYPNNTIQHAGILLDGIVAGNLYSGFPRSTVGVANRARLVQNLSAVTGACLVVKKTIWNEVGGMDEINFRVAFNDVDFCLKVRQLGYRNLWTPFAELYHHESVSRGRDDTPEKLARFQSEIACMQQRWGDLLRNDPAWSPNLEPDGSWLRPAHPPRSNKPWRQFGGGH